jgi:hypothetical protein
VNVQWNVLFSNYFSKQHTKRNAPEELLPPGMCNPLEFHLCFGGKYCLHLQGLSMQSRWQTNLCIKKLVCVNPEDEDGMHNLSLCGDCNDPICDKERVFIFILMVHQTD